MKLVVGLGNPGLEYANTRHNVGFMAVDEICSRYNFSSFKTKFDGLIAEANIDGQKIYLLKPMTFMNLSGNCVVKAAMFYKILPQDIIVIHDDLDLVIGKVKAKIGGGHAGHNGLKSIDAHITNNYNRIRIGIGGTEKEKVVAHVLGSFNKTDAQLVEQNIQTIATNLPVLLKDDLANFSNLIAQGK